MHTRARTLRPTPSLGLLLATLFLVPASSQPRLFTSLPSPARHALFARHFTRPPELAQYASREAADYLAAALEQGDRLGAELGLATDPAIVEDLAQARQRLGEYESAQSLWERALRTARPPRTHMRPATQRKARTSCEGCLTHGGECSVR